MTDRRSHLRHWRTAPIRTQPEVAAIIGITRDQVYEAEKNAIRKLRDGLSRAPEVKELLEKGS